MVDVVSDDLTRAVEKLLSVTVPGRSVLKQNAAACADAMADVGERVIRALSQLLDAQARATGSEGQALMLQDMLPDRSGQNDGGGRSSKAGRAGQYERITAWRRVSSASRHARLGCKKLLDGKEPAAKASSSADAEQETMADCLVNLFAAASGAGSAVAARPKPAAGKQSRSLAALVDRLLDGVEMDATFKDPDSESGGVGVAKRDQDHGEHKGGTSKNERTGGTGKVETPKKAKKAKRKSEGGEGAKPKKKKKKQ